MSYPQIFEAKVIITKYISLRFVKLSTYNEQDVYLCGMFQIDKTIVSEEIISNDFVCNLSACKGACCIDGEAGAPLEESELSILESIYPSVKPYLRPEGLTAIEAQGVYIKGVDGDWETPLIDGADCAYVIFDNKGVALCCN